MQLGNLLVCLANVYGGYTFIFKVMYVRAILFVRARNAQTRFVSNQGQGSDARATYTRKIHMHTTYATLSLEDNQHKHMDKKYFHHIWTQIRPIKTWYLLLAFLLCVGVAVFALRNNYSTMVELRENVYQADREGEGVEESLQALRAYVNSHMNTNLTSGSESVYPPIQLSETYKRLQEAELAKVNATNPNLYTEAQEHCERSTPDSFSGGPRVPCIEQYVKEHGQSLEPVPDELYKFDFVSPAWSPDLAGWSLVLSSMLLVLVAARFLLGRLVKRSF